MQRKVANVSEYLSERLFTWEQVDCIARADTLDVDVYDPYFYISLDVYYRGEIPDVEERMGFFSEAGAFESSSVASKDRFLIDNLPIRVEYKDMSRVDQILARTDENMWVFRQTGTYMFYRLETAEVLKKRSDWIDQVREKLDQLPELFWKRLANAGRATMEHYLSDLTAAVMREDELFYLISAAGFLKSFLSLLFVVNRKFEPSGRMLCERVWNLPELPENFKGRFSSFLRQDPEFPPSRKRELAELLAKSAVMMS